MLYVTTRNSRDLSPSLRPLVQDDGPAGGLYVPHDLPALTTGGNFGEQVAQLLNGLYLPRLTGAKVDFAIGRSPVRLRAMHHRIAMAECWHNPQWDMDWAATELLHQIYPEGKLEKCSEWGRLSVRMAMLAGVLQSIADAGLAGPDSPVDIAVEAGDFGWPMAAVYLRKMGAPIGTIVCACLDNSALWDLFHRGELRTRDPAAAGVYRGLERLVCTCLGQEEAGRYSEICSRRGIYAPAPEQLALLQDHMYAAVLSTRRVRQLMRSVYHSSGDILTLEAAAAYAGLMDYRAATADARTSLVMMEKSPACEAGTVGPALGLTAEQIMTRLDQT